MKIIRILLLISLLILSLPLLAQALSNLYLKNVNGKFGWFETGNDKIDWTYLGEINNGKPNGRGVLSTTFGKYSGEFKNGMMDGQGIFTNNSGIKTVGEFRKSKPWNVINYNKSGIIEAEWIKGVKSKNEKVLPLELKEFSEKWAYRIGFRFISGNTFAKPNTSNNSLSLIWENYGLGFNQMSFNDISSTNNIIEMENSSIDLSYKIGKKLILIAGTGYVYGGKGSITSGSSAINYEAESVSGLGLFGLFGVW